MADTPSPSKKSNLVKLAIGVLMAVAGAGGADAAGFQFDPQMLKEVGGYALIVYLELRIRPLLVVIAKREAISGELLDTTAASLIAPAPIPEPLPVPAPITAPIARPRIAVVRPTSVVED